MAKRSPAVDIAKNSGQGVDLEKPLTLSTGFEARLIPIPTATIQEAVVAIKDPPIPTQNVEGKDYPVENPKDPDYLRKKTDIQRERESAAYDVMAMLGVELVNGMPEDDTWLRKLKLLEKKKRIDLSGYDLEDEFEKEFVFKRYYAMAAEDWNLLATISGVTQEDIARAKDNFRG